MKAINSMLEAAARAMYEDDMLGITEDHYREWDRAHEVTKQRYRDRVTAALRAMREVPVTEQMISNCNLVYVAETVTIDTFYGTPETDRAFCQLTWRALLGAVIGEK